MSSIQEKLAITPEILPENELEMFDCLFEDEIKDPTPIEKVFRQKYLGE